MLVPYKIVPSGKDIARSLKLVATRDFKKGSVVHPLEGKPIAGVFYHTVQVGQDQHIELTNDLVYCNHSCDPSLNFDTARMLTVAVKDIQEGDELTFFYPSSEWDMVEQFSCICNSSQCIGEIKGAKYLSEETLSRYFINEHIRKQYAQSKSN
ncbi:hypothetical protein K493DRAFT_245202 [Basidiobolus meristosporus CBS 931.73]|uniref:SET domain-containing protein n=1 Tax=Basidiobolus meristosporus CBS 931.73 TaxID=1314790 RepID=A0A1Y1WVT2_9FUNG|nr:hypothetical protein K493DRAFT_245202 [Basidiobolus meristosporus CBS 931.73]|eukprot:ORX77572.1 hypothetical protein K493DRAFT_245202 [Basidiobolus meristosporus CBS 931.73]